MTASILIEPLQPEHAQAVARLHAEGIRTGFLTSLGPRFLTALYRAISQSHEAFGFVAVRNGQPVGFVACSSDLSRLYKSLLRQCWWRFGLILIGRMLSWSTIRRIWQTWRYPARSELEELPAAELLSVTVSELVRGQGVGSRLLQRGFEECAERGISGVKVLVAKSNAPANRLYARSGFRQVGSLLSHGVESNLYVRDC